MLHSKRDGGFGDSCTVYSRKEMVAPWICYTILGRWLWGWLYTVYNVQQLSWRLRGLLHSNREGGSWMAVQAIISQQ